MAGFFQHRHQGINSIENSYEGGRFYDPVMQMPCLWRSFQELDSSFGIAVVSKCECHKM
jgi:hypothetical protein